MTIYVWDVCRCLVDLAVCEPGENWLGEHLDGKEFELPSTWMKEVLLLPPGRAKFNRGECLK